MGNIKSKFSVIAAITAMTLLILDSKTVTKGAYEGLILCFTAVIPSLFPLIFLSGILTTALSQSRFMKLPFLSKICRIPDGSEIILITGLIGGYPIGARCISDAYRNGQLSKTDAERMLGFSSNAGPAFIFGMAGNLFENPWVPWVLWGIHIVSALAVGVLLPGTSTSTYVHNASKKLSVSDAVIQSVKTMGIICGWIVIFRVIIAFLTQWVLSSIPNALAVGLCGIMELSNGIVALQQINSDLLRFIFAGGFLAFGGICVWLQTVSVTEKLGSGLYFPGKLLQTGISLLLSFLASLLLFEGSIDYIFPSILIVLLIVILAATVLPKKTVAIHNNLLYNDGNSR